MTMRNDASRPQAPVKEPRPLRSVVARQGQVLLDTDVNDAAALALARVETADAHMLGSQGRLLVPAGSSAFAISGAAPAFGIGAGTAYLDGWQLVNSAAATLATQPNPWTGAAPAVPAVLAIRAVVRHIDPAEEPTLADVALGDAQSSGRSLIDWQVLPVPSSNSATCGNVTNLPAWTAMAAPSSGQLAFVLPTAPPSADPCSLTPAGGHSRFENLLYRIEVHGGTPLADSPGPHDPRFGIAGLRLKLSRRNASLMVRVAGVNGTRLAVQPPALDPGNWFVPGAFAELVRQGDDVDATGAMTRERLFRIADADDNMVQLVEAAVGDVAATGVAGDGRWFVRLWDAWPDGEGVRVVPAGGGTFDLGDGIAIRLAAQAGVRLRRGDWWNAAVRADGSIAWPGIETPNPTPLPPMGPAWRYAPLALLGGTGTAPTLTDCRIPFATLSDRSLLYRGGDGQGLFAPHAASTSFVPLPQRLRVAVMRGATPVVGATVRWRLPAGALPSQIGGALVDAGTVRDLPTGPDGLCEVVWSIDASRQDATHQVEAVLLDNGQPATTPAIQFNARFDSAGLTAFRPPTSCPTLAQSTNVQDALEKLCAALDERDPPTIGFTRITLQGRQPIELIRDDLILNGLEINAEDLRGGIIFETDAKQLECTPRPDDPIIEVAFDLPYPTTDADKLYWVQAGGAGANRAALASPFGTRTTRLDGRVDVQGTTMAWKVDKVALPFLLTAARHQFGYRVNGDLSAQLKENGWSFPAPQPVLCRIRVRGALVFGVHAQTGKTAWLNAQHLGTSAGATARELLVKERDPRRAGDLEIFLWVIPEKAQEGRFLLVYPNGGTAPSLANNGDVNTLLDEIVASQRASGAAVTLRAHADDGTAPAAQLQMSNRRGEAVRAALVQRGMPAQVITVQALGNAEPPATPEPWGNRRVEIILG